MRLLTWNVNGWRACMKKGFNDSIAPLNVDAIMLQEIKMKQEQINFRWDDSYQLYMNSAMRAGYSGTALLTRIPPLDIRFGVMGDDEGRIIIAEFEAVYLVGMYTPSSKEGLSRLPYRLQWDSYVWSVLSALNTNKPVILCGDLNVAHTEIDLRYPLSNEMSPGYSVQERNSFSNLLSQGFVDSFRYLYPNARGEYTYWSNFGNARANNSGWRLDYFVVSDSLKNYIKEVKHHSEILGSDHCPVSMEIEL